MRSRPGVFGKINKHIHFDMSLSLRTCTIGTGATSRACCSATPWRSHRLALRSPFASLPTARAGGDDALYSLYAVLVHLDFMGSTGFGHYICYVRDTKSNTWHEINDSKVS